MNDAGIWHLEIGNLLERWSRLRFVGLHFPVPYGKLCPHTHPSNCSKHLEGPWTGVPSLKPAFCPSEAVSSFCLLLAMSLPRVCFYGFNLNKGFLISCLRSCQSEKFLYYMRLQVLELSRLHNTQHHYPAAPYHSGWRACGIRCHHLPRPRHQPAVLQPPGSAGRNRGCSISPD